MEMHPESGARWLSAGFNSPQSNQQGRVPTDAVTQAGQKSTNPSWEGSSKIILDKQSFQKYWTITCL